MYYKLRGIKIRDIILKIKRGSNKNKNKILIKNENHIFHLFIKNFNFNFVGCFEEFLLPLGLLW
jgi:hypothetical protein